MWCLSFCDLILQKLASLNATRRKELQHEFSKQFPKISFLFDMLLEWAYKDLNEFRSEGFVCSMFFFFFFLFSDCSPPFS
jgi:hypothetical protein